MFCCRKTCIASLAETKTAKEHTSHPSSSSGGQQIPGCIWKPDSFSSKLLNSSWFSHSLHLFPTICTSKTCYVWRVPIPPFGTFISSPGVLKHSWNSSRMAVSMARLAALHIAHTFTGHSGTCRFAQNQLSFFLQENGTSLQIFFFSLLGLGARLALGLAKGCEGSCKNCCSFLVIFVIFAAGDDVGWTSAQKMSPSLCTAAVAAWQVGVVLAQQVLAFGLLGPGGGWGVRVCRSVFELWRSKALGYEDPCWRRFVKLRTGGPWFMKFMFPETHKS